MESRMVGLVWGTLLGLITMVNIVNGDVYFSTLPHSLTVTATVQNTGNHAGDPKAGEDHIAVQWALNTTFAGQDTTYSKVNLKLCFAPPSQVDRGWRKTVNDLKTDKTCSGASIASQKYTPTGNSTMWLISKETPGAMYFVRAYAVDANGVQLAYGQSTNKAKTTNIFKIDAISGRSTSLDIASAVFSVFAVVALFSYLGIETMLNKRKARLNGQK
ncbi:unnamed protein product [Calypogeia fissa]